VPGERKYTLREWKAAFWVNASQSSIRATTEDLADLSSTLVGKIDRRSKNPLAILIGYEDCKIAIFQLRPFLSQTRGDFPRHLLGCGVIRQFLATLICYRF
jgi:hypothetical protein